MRINIEFPDEWEQKLEEYAKMDGHSNRAAVIRKIVNNFFAGELAFSRLYTEWKEKTQQDQTTKN